VVAAEVDERLEQRRLRAVDLFGSDDVASDGPPGAVAELVDAVRRAAGGIEVVVRLADLRPLPPPETTTPP
jgi:NAD(P)-dependent dehydrogenase (short-subunit alcohol dehydrogenase family)